MPACPHIAGLNSTYIVRALADRLKSQMRTSTKEHQTCSTCRVSIIESWLCLKDNCNLLFCERDRLNHSQGEHVIFIGVDTGFLFCSACSSDIFPQESIDYQEHRQIIEALIYLQILVQKKFEDASLRKIVYLSAPGQKPPGVCGLLNIGNTCFMNASLQALFACRYFPRYFRKGFTAVGIGKKVVLANHFSTVIKEMWATQKRAISPNPIFREVIEINPFFDGYHQQDAQEFIRCVLDRLNDELKEIHISSNLVLEDVGSTNSITNGAETSTTPQLSPRSHPSLISDLFEGEFATHLICKGCNQRSIRTESFHDISVGIAKKSKKKSERRKSGSFWSLSLFKKITQQPEQGSDMSISDCLNEFNEEEHLKDDDKLTCDHCHKLNEFSRRQYISKLPQVVCLHFKRFRYSKDSGVKVSTKVAFFNELDLSPYLPPKETRGNWDNTRKYELTAVICHRGNFNGGHYFAFAKTKHGRWFLFDDDKVEPVEIDVVFQQEAYILFYQNVRPQKELLEIRHMIRTRTNEKQYYLSTSWYTRWKNYPEPGPIVNTDFSCQHGKGFRPGINRDMYRTIPESAWRQLQRKYGGGPEVVSLSVCELCQALKIKIDARKKEEKRRISEIDSTQIGQGDKWYLIHSDWLIKWHNFTNEEFDLSPPGPISNKELLTSDGRILMNLEKAKHYRGINQRVWEYFVQQYGGGPAIVRSALDIYGS